MNDQQRKFIEGVDRGMEELVKRAFAAERQRNMAASQSLHTAHAVVGVFRDAFYNSVKDS